MLTMALAFLLTVSAAYAHGRQRRSVAGRPDPRRDLAVLAMQLGRGLRGGLTPLEVLEDSSKRMTGTLGFQLQYVCAQMNRGVSLDAAFLAWEEAARESAGAGASLRKRLRGAPRVAPLPDDVELLAAAARFGHAQGRGHAEVFEAVGATMIDRAEVADEVGALTAQARASVLVLCALPVLGLLVLAVVDPALGTVLFTERAGLAALVVAVCLDSFALWIGSRLLHRVLR